ncbi:MAG: helix-turn-helix domain-containing protein [Actinomycetota bacterium]|nr:helix-turn-helix domain-containing protein [Actinomycetota bacterium]
MLAEGVPVDLGGMKERTLLGLLVLDAGRVISVERLIDELWGLEVDRFVSFLNVDSSQKSPGEGMRAH